MWDSTDYELDWPNSLVRAELLALCSHRHRSWSADEIELLLTEAFHTEVPAADYRQVSAFTAWADDSRQGQDWINDLLDNLDKIRQYCPPKPYWRDRHRRPRPRNETQRRAAVYEQLDALLGEFHANGYLARDYPSPCVDDGSDPDSNSNNSQVELWETVRLRIGGLKLWPLPPGSWREETFYSLIEVYHDLVARPRRRWDHVHNDCGWHFEDFDTDAGRRVYRSLVNRLLAENGVELRLAEHGEDAGRLVHVADEGRIDLVERALANPDPSVNSGVAHAIALFRARDADEEGKRSAIVALASVLEDRRRLLKTSLFRADEGALFCIANGFDLRHRNDRQHANYDPAFRDWVFWWYLATIELTDRLLARQAAAQTATTQA